AVDERPVRPDPTIDLSALGGALPEGPTDPREVLRLLAEVAAPATMAMAGPRFFGWVIGGAYPVSVAADWLTSAWDQNTVFAEAAPATAALEAAALRWVREACGLPQ